MQKLKLEEILAEKSRIELLDLAEALNVYETNHKYNKQKYLFPESGKYPRSAYPKHLLFLKAGSCYKERCLMAANRIAKTYLACCEDSFHLNGRYPDWWEGKVFNEPVLMWVSGKSHKTTRDILQQYLLGPRNDIGSGMIPREDIIGNPTSAPGTPGAILDVFVKHYTNGIYDGDSHLIFKSEDQGVEAFYGDAVHVCHLDEEHNNDIYSECLIRTMTTHGILTMTFTPKKGMSDTVLRFMPNGKFPLHGMGQVEEEDE